MPIVQATNLDSVRIEVLGEGRALTIPASLILAANRVFRTALMTDSSVVVEQEDANDPPRKIWIAMLGGEEGAGETPWSAVSDLADKIQGGGR